MYFLYNLIKYSEGIHLTIKINVFKSVPILQNLHRTLVLIRPLQQSQEGCVCYGPSAIQDHQGVKHVRVVCHNVSGRGVGGLCHCEEALNGNSWHQRSQLTTRTITYWTKKSMEKQHRIYVIGLWVTDPIHVWVFYNNDWAFYYLYPTTRT